MCTTITIAAQPTPADATDALLRVRGWVREGRVTAGGGAGSTELAAVTLRLDGRVIGRADESGDAPLVTATAAALRRARETAARGEVGLLAENAWTDVRPRIRVAIELADELIPLTADEIEIAEAARTAGFAGLVVRPGLEGVAARQGERVLWRSAGWLRDRGLSPGAAMATLAGQLADDPSLGIRPLPDLVGQGFTFFRVPTVEIADIGTPPVPTFLHRGGTVVPSDLGRAGILEAGSAIVQHLERRRWPGVEHYGLRGTYDAGDDAYSPLFASAFEQGIAIAALKRWGEVANDAGARRLAELLIEDLTQIEPEENDPAMDAPSAAAAVLAGIEGDMLDRAAATLANAFDGTALADTLPRGAQGLVAHALVRLAARGRIETSLAASAVSAVYRDTLIDTLVSQMPFLLWASVELTELEDGPVAAAAVLAELRAVIDVHRLTRQDLVEQDRDLAGAVVFTRSRSPLPTWQSVRAAAVTATMLGEPSLTPTSDAGELAGRIVDQLAADRFLVQLQTRDAEAHAAARADMALGGVRSALWTDRMPVLPSALVLWSFAETIESLDAVSEALRRP
ncbi:MAG: hypothetical protein AAGI17_06680 [Planctomycetota bacterium]